jgi:cysteine-rich repeat protein
MVKGGARPSYVASLLVASAVLACGDSPETPAVADAGPVDSCGNAMVDDGEECDDGNGRELDGCSSSCRLTPMRWLTSGAPRAAGHAVAYDAGRRRVVLFGGDDGTGPSDQTWEWDGDMWLEVGRGAPAPPPRIGHAMVYDARRGGTVLFGGRNSDGLLADMWRWDGASWTRLTPSISPSARVGHAMAYDAGRDRVVLHGGENGNALTDTWEWDGVTWQQVGQQQVSGEAMVYDPIRGLVVMGAGAKMWEWDGDTWNRHPDSLNSDEPRSETGFQLVYDVSQRSVVRFGGSANGAPSDELWQWTPAQGWVELVPATSTPEARVDHQLAFDIARNQVVLVGGNNGTTILEDSWRWNGTDWIDASTPAAPPPRGDAAMAYDALRGHVAIHGGLDSMIERNDTWELRSGHWYEALPLDLDAERFSQHHMVFDAARGQLIFLGGAYPGAPDSCCKGRTWGRVDSGWVVLNEGVNGFYGRFGFGMAYDPSRKKVMVAGGFFTVGVTNALDDSWLWDGTTWSLAGMIPDDGYTDLVYQDARQRLLLITRDVTWEWDGSAWNEVASQAPVTSTVYDSNRSTVVGVSTSNGTWEWDGTEWIAPVLDSSPPGGPTAYDPLRARVVLFDGESSQVESRTWFYSPRAIDPEQCLSGLDADGDGLAGCADPDCWGYCTPLCAPGSTPGWPADCETSQPHCGDGTCSAGLETCRLCPQDCGACAPLCGDFVCDPAESTTSCPGDCVP